MMVLVDESAPWSRPIVKLVRIRIAEVELEVFQSALSQARQTTTVALRFHDTDLGVYLQPEELEVLLGGEVEVDLAQPVELAWCDLCAENIEQKRRIEEVLVRTNSTGLQSLASNLLADSEDTLVGHIWALSCITTQLLGMVAIPRVATIVGPENDLVGMRDMIVAALWVDVLAKDVPEDI